MEGGSEKPSFLSNGEYMEKKIKEYAKRNEKETIELLKTLAKIPAPSGKEEKRARFCKEWLEVQGAKGVYIDSALNVIYPVCIEIDEKIDVYAAHMDVVFPDEQELPLVEGENRIYCPGIGDDTSCLASLLMAGKYIAQNIDSLNLKRGVLLVCDSGEEGLGNLKGIREICNTFGKHINSFCTFDSVYDKMVDRAVGSVRYEITIRTKGGHSFNDFGRENAIVQMAELIGDLTKITLPTKGITTYNIGTIEGGTSVNTIAQQAKILYEFRSDIYENLEYMESEVEKLIKKMCEDGLNVDSIIIGKRPCGKMVDEEKQKNLVQEASDIVESIIGRAPQRDIGSTDCNIPLSLGIPSVCIGCYLGKGQHTREEYIEKEGINVGVEIVLRMICR